MDAACLHEWILCIGAVCGSLTNYKGYGYRHHVQQPYTDAVCVCHEEFPYTPTTHEGFIHCKCSKLVSVVHE